MSILMGYLRLMRPANIITSISDILGGAAIAGMLVSVVLPEIRYGTPLSVAIAASSASVFLGPLLLLVLSTSCLYGGGVVLNDYFDAALDKIERPERPIPSGLIARRSAGIFGLSLLCGGIIFAALADIILYKKVFTDGSPVFASAVIATTIALASVVYDKWGKHQLFLGPVNMGLCRALNLLLGISLLSSYPLWVFWPVAIVPVIYIAAITMISRGEVHGGGKTTLYLAAVLYAAVLSVILYLSYLFNNFAPALIFAAIFSLLIFPSLLRAMQVPEGRRIGKAVKSGVIAVIAMNASWAAAFGDVYLAVVILLLLPLSLLLAKLFAVT